MTQKTGGTPRYALLDHVPEMVTISDRRGRILYANPATERVSGFAPEEFVSLEPFSRMHPEDRPRCEEAFAELLGNPGQSLHLEHRVRHKDGSWRWVEGTFTSLFEDPEVGGLLATVRDVTERKRTEEALRESEERYRLAVEAADLGRWELVPETGEFYTSPTCNRHLGLPEGARPTHEGHFRTIHPDDHAMIYERLRRAIEEGGEFEAEYRVIHPSGGVRRILSRARLLRYPGSAPDSLTGVTLDVTEARELEEERERARARGLAERAEAAERERINRELHDRVAHTMGVAHQSLELHSVLAGSAPERAAEKLELAREATRTALDQTRDLSSQLARRQTEETRDGLTSALRELLETHVPDGVETDLSATGDETAIPPPVREQAYLVMREAVRNAVEHSGCPGGAWRTTVGDSSRAGAREEEATTGRTAVRPRESA
jgi:PAS domain S-box-containing protein